MALPNSCRCLSGCETFCDSSKPRTVGATSNRAVKMQFRQLRSKTGLESRGSQQNRWGREDVCCAGIGVLCRPEGLHVAAVFKVRSCTVTFSSHWQVSNVPTAAYRFAGLSKNFVARPSTPAMLMSCAKTSPRLPNEERRAPFGTEACAYILQKAPSASAFPCNLALSARRYGCRFGARPPRRAGWQLPTREFRE